MSGEWHRRRRDRTDGDGQPGGEERIWAATGFSAPLVFLPKFKTGRARHIERQIEVMPASHHNSKNPRGGGGGGSRRVQEGCKSWKSSYNPDGGEDGDKGDLKLPN
ncbi:hypothetical protein Q1695_001229 [Nippostrongylus brasiliensis]|nr:hypothetical protein Q1695_001229 [Nippostrongylus brasiliensis]